MRRATLSFLLYAVLILATACGGAALFAGGEDMVTITIDGKTMTVTKAEAERLQDAARRLDDLAVGQRISERDYYAVVGEPKDALLPSPAEQERRAGADRITIPGLTASLALVPSGITALNEVDVPSGLSSVGWVRTTAEPDADGGTSLYVFHRDTGGGTRGTWSPFYGIGELGAGARIEVTWHGVTERVRIARYASVPKDRLPTDLFATRGTRQIAFVTCGGPLARGADGLLHWSRRLITYAVPA
jgi:hypothetical protein